MIVSSICIIILSINLIHCQKCQNGQNFCKLCNPITKLCAQCYNSDVLAPNENGGCEGIKKCERGFNYCSECNADGNLCLQCQDGYIPDENGGCTYATNCEVSSEGICIKCKQDYILIGQNTFNNKYDNIKICKYNNSEEFKNCEVINTEKGGCSRCKQDYYLTGKDKKCITMKNCAEAKFGICQECNVGYYLDKSKDMCIQVKDNFLHCKMTLDGKNCDSCVENYYFDENGLCIINNYCLQEEDYNCQKCESGYYLTESFECTPDKNCKIGNKDLGICKICKDNYYIDFTDGKCKSNKEDNDFKYCKYADNGVCTQCIDRYYISKDFKCTPTQNCVEAENGICQICEDNYYLGLDNKCNSVKYCIYSGNNGECVECEDKYYYDTNSRSCKISENEFMNCKSGAENIHCDKCKDNFYINTTDFLCYSNLDKGKFYKCAATNYNAEFCSSCIEGYYLGNKDLKCSTVEGCEISENEDRCMECDSAFYCLDRKTGKCELNYDIEKEEQIIYYRCNTTNLEGTKCEQCVNNDDDQYILNENGICINENRCVEKKDGICQKCENELFTTYCLNNIFGCVKMFTNNCLECNDIFNLGKCTKCFEGYELNKYNYCIKTTN